MPGIRDRTARGAGLQIQKDLNAPPYVERFTESEDRQTMPLFAIRWSRDPDARLLNAPISCQRAHLSSCTGQPQRNGFLECSYFRQAAKVTDVRLSSLLA